MSRTVKDTPRANEQVQLLQKIHPSVRHLVQHVIQPGVIESLDGTISILDVTSSSAPSLGKPVQSTGDCVLLKVPYAGQSVPWQVLFNGQFPGEAPDIICGDPVFVPDLRKASERLQLLQTWNMDDPESLVNLIKAMIELYADFQVAQIPKDSILYHLHNSLYSLDVLPSDVEILVTPNSQKLRWNLNLHFPQLPLFENWSREQNTASVQFTVTQEKVSSVQLFLNPALEEQLTADDQSNSPRLSSGVAVNNYVKNLKDHLQNICHRLAVKFELRRKLVAALETVFAKVILNDEKDTFQRIVMYITYESLPVIVHVNLSEGTGASIQPVVSIYTPRHRVTCSGKTEMFSIEYKSSSCTQTTDIHAFCKSFYSGLLDNLAKFRSSIPQTG